MKIPYHSRFDDSTKKTAERPAGIPRVSNLWVLLWVWLSKMNNVASSNSFPTPESSFCPPSGFARGFVGRTWSGERRVFFWTTQACPRAQENPTNDSLKFHWLPKPHNYFKFPSKKSPFHPIKKSIKTHQIFLQNPQKVAAQKKSTKFSKEWLKSALIKCCENIFLFTLFDLLIGVLLINWILLGYFLFEL